MKRVGIFGSTGSIGINALQVIRDNPQFFKVTVLAAGSNDKLLLKQALEFRPEVIVIKDSEKAEELTSRLKKEKIRVVSGEEGLILAAAWEKTDQLLFSIVGSEGLLPLCEAIKAGKRVAVANKEPLVMAGRYIQDLVKRHNTQLIPVDSEHSAIWQCLEGHQHKDVRKIHLTASGGPFLNLSKKELEAVTPKEALAHPRWDMGKKITIDSATLMNKGLELIEACYLFSLKPSQIEILIHPEAAIHSLVEFKDGSFLAQLSTADMKLPIQYALSYPERIPSSYPVLDLKKLGALTFKKPDIEKFPALEIAIEAAEAGGTMPAALNAANEVAVDLFLKEEIKFLEITQLIQQVLDQHQSKSNPGLSDILEADRWARCKTEEIMGGRISI